MSGLSLRDVIGHQTAVQLLQRTVASGRVAPGYLFFGPPQVGKRTLALAFAAALNCESGGEDACGVCLSCRKVADGTHPDVRVVEPEGNTFRIEQVREVSRQIALTPLEGRYKVYLLQKVETMRPEGANALLKTLEEPPGSGVLLLVTTNVNAILPTIRSRCQPIPLRPLPVRALEEELCRRGISPERAHRIALMAQGRVGAAFDLLESASEGGDGPQSAGAAARCSLEPSFPPGRILGGGPWAVGAAVELVSRSAPGPSWSPSGAVDLSGGGANAPGAGARRIGFLVDCKDACAHGEPIPPVPERQRGVDDGSVGLSLSSVAASGAAGGPLSGRTAIGLCCQSFEENRMKPKFYVTTAIPYVNAKPHLGHSYEMVATDVIARYKRMAGFDVWFLTGADMNSLNTERKARELGRDVREYVEEMADAMVQTWKALRISNDDFIRTTEPRHRRAAQECFRRAYENGDIYEATYEGFYCYSCEAYYDPDDLLEGNRCPVHQSPCEWLAERNYFFRLSRYEAALRKHIEEHPEFIYPESRRNEVLAFLDRGLKDFSVSRRSARWGIPTPTDPNQVIYVWFDALVNYLTGAGFPDHPEAFQKWWPCDVHVIGKDIWRFHCIYWPAMLMSAGIELPKKVAIHGFVTLGGEKMSKSRGIYVDPVAAVREYGADAIRYYLVREVPFETDGDFTWEAFVARYNADLANDLGNLLNRTLNLVRRHFGGKTPPIGEPTAEDVALAKAVLRAREEYCRLMEGFSLHLATDQAMGIVREANRYLADTEPWRLLRDERRDRAGTVLYHAMEALRWAATLLTPVMPDACQQIRAQLGIPEETPDLTRLEWGWAPSRESDRGGTPPLPAPAGSGGAAGRRFFCPHKEREDRRER
ncbi:MAG: hypothetical protein KatS3mg115_1489 [Candidatus Poribacteria bacterium]|nr:MAG: hypothetical protein KatS3mg115_1489 [Candidatus Poribacteria bacterium]